MDQPPYITAAIRMKDVGLGRRQRTMEYSAPELIAPKLGGSGDIAAWSRKRDLNPRPDAYKTTALPLSYSGLSDAVNQAAPVKENHILR